MARVVAFIPDLLFGSGVVSTLQSAGHEVELRSDPGDLTGADVLVVDLTSDPDTRIEQVREQRSDGVPALAFYSHVEADVRTRAQAAGFELVVPRSRMAREGAALVEQLLEAGG